VKSALSTPASSDDDARFMALALALGRRGLGRTWPNPAVGAVIVTDGIVVGRGWTQAGGRPHAEVEALARAGNAANGATMYVTLEPCAHHGKTPPCADAIVAAGIARVVSALEDPNPKVAGQGHARLRASGIAVDVGEGAEQARRDHIGHIRRIVDGRPHVTLKLAASADGKAGFAGRIPAVITGEPARLRVHRLRAINDAILIGIGTALSDDPVLTCRLSGMQQRSPVRVVLDAHLRLPAESRLASTAHETPVWVVAASDAPREREEALRALGVDVLRLPAPDGKVDITALLKELAARGITRLMVEGGPIVAASFVAAGLVDEAMLLRGPGRIGDDGIDALDGMPLSNIGAPAFISDGIDAVGDDTIEMFTRVR
jgi:diaminohydroxyphosphoribosylaminopyrimidine deaminase/5-amino-6-(5-phosphoribosylamino)uracil reductase